MSTVSVNTANGRWLVQGIQLKNRRFVPKWLGDLVLWAFFHRTDTKTSVTLSGFSGGKQ